MATQTCRVCGGMLSHTPGAPCPFCHAQREEPRPAAPPVLLADRSRIPRLEVGGQTAQYGSFPSQGLDPSNSDDVVVEGAVLQTFGPTHAEGRRDWWRLGSIILLVSALFPLFVGVWMILAMFRLALAFVGLRLGGGRGLLGEILTFHVVGNTLRTPDPIPVYDHVIDTGAGLAHVRQEGEFEAGRIFVGNRVRLRGRLQAGALVIEEGFNQTLGTRLAFRTSPWRGAFSLLFLMFAAGLAFLMLSTPPGLVGR